MKSIFTLQGFLKCTFSTSLFQSVIAGALVCTPWKLWDSTFYKYCSELDYFTLNLWLLDGRFQLWTLFSLFNDLLGLRDWCWSCLWSLLWVWVECFPRTCMCMEGHFKRKIFRLCHIVVYSPAFSDVFAWARICSEFLECLFYFLLHESVLFFSCLAGTPPVRLAWSSGLHPG